MTSLRLVTILLCPLPASLRPRFGQKRGVRRFAADRMRGDSQPMRKPIASRFRASLAQLLQLDHYHAGGCVSYVLADVCLLVGPHYVTWLEFAPQHLTSGQR